jgi:hypothetical protein
MFIGHFAVALAAKRVAPQASLGVLFTAAQLPDIVWPGLVLTGAETVEIHPGDTAFTPLTFTSYPWSHSLLMVALTGTAAGVAYGWRTRYRAGALAVALLALSHWVLDWVAHRPDLPLVPGGAVYGLGLWNSVPMTILVEGALFAAGVIVYAAGTRSVDRVGRYALWSMIAFLALVYVGNVFGRPPPSAKAVAWVTLSGAIFLFAWANWADRHRRPA